MSKRILCYCAGLFLMAMGVSFSGKADLGMAGMTVTEERKQMVSFSDTYATGVQVIIVKDDSPITSVDDLLADGANYTVGTQNATTGYIYAMSDIEDAGKGTVAAVCQRCGVRAGRHSELCQLWRWSTGRSTA